MTGERHDDDAERVVLGSLLDTPRYADDIAATGITSGDFFQPAHEAIFDAIAAQQRDLQPHTPVEVAQRLAGGLKRVGGTTYLHTLISSVPTAANGPYQARTVVALARLRRAQQLATKIDQLAETTPADQADDAIETMRALFDERTRNRTTGNLHTFGALLDEAMDRWDTPDTNVLPTGLTDLDTLLSGGLRPGHLFVIAARPAVGKSVAAAVIAGNVVQHGNPTLFASLEMSRAEVVDRIAANVAGVDIGHLVRRELDANDWQRVAKIQAHANDWPLWIDDRAGITVSAIRGRARDLHRKDGLRLIVVDYLQIVAPADRREQRERQVGRVAEDLRAVGKELNVPVVALAQINRESTKRTDSRPTMADIRESGNIEAHADEIVLLHRDDENLPGEIEFIVDKNRHGRTGKVAMAWAGHQSRIASLARWNNEGRPA